MIGALLKMSFLTFGTSPKKKMAKTPAATPNPARIVPYRVALVAFNPIKFGLCFVLNLLVLTRERLRRQIERKSA